MEVIINDVTLASLKAKIKAYMTLFDAEEIGVAVQGTFREQADGELVFLNRGYHTVNATSIGRVYLDVHYDGDFHSVYSAEPTIDAVKLWRIKKG